MLAGVQVGVALVAIRAHSAAWAWSFVGTRRFFHTLTRAA